MSRPRRNGTPSTAPNRRRLSHFTIKNLKPQERAYATWDIVQRGLCIVMQPTGRAAWKTVYSHRGRPRWIHLADASAIGLADARKLANEIMYRVAQGADPAAERRAERSADTFEELATRYSKYSQRRNKSWRQADKLVTKYLLPKWGKLAAASIVRADVKALIGAVGAPVLANQILASASAVFTWAIREEAAGIKINPCSGIERNKTASRERILSDNEISLFWSEFDAAGIEGTALKVILLCGQRPGEVVHMRTEHRDANWWTMPGEPVPSLDWPGTKNSATHRIWLPETVRHLIADTTGRVFGEMTTNQLSRTMRIICTKLKVDRLTPHDLRRSHGSTITGLGFGRDALNRIQNHKEGSIADVYDRHGYAEENRKIMKAVSSRIMHLVEGGPDNVLAFKQAI